jgi:transposase
VTVFQTVERVRARFKNFKSSKKKFVLSVYTVYPPLSILYSLFQVQSSSFSLDAQEEEEEQRKKEGENKSLWPSL